MNIFLILNFICLPSFWMSAFGLPYYHQDSFDVKPEKLEVVRFDHSLIRDLNFTYGWLNKTAWALNGSMYNIAEPTRDIVIEVQLTKFAKKVYRPIHLPLSSNACEEYDRNNFDLQNLLKNKSNIVHGCPFEKGYYYINNVVPDFSLLPPFIPRGKYKAIVKVYYNKKFAGEGHGYGEVVDKPKNN